MVAQTWTEIMKLNYLLWIHDLPNKPLKCTSYHSSSCCSHPGQPSPEHRRWQSDELPNSLGGLGPGCQAELQSRTSAHDGVTRVEKNTKNTQSSPESVIIMNLRKVKNHDTLSNESDTCYMRTWHHYVIFLDVNILHWKALNKHHSGNGTKGCMKASGAAWQSLGYCPFTSQEKWINSHHNAKTIRICSETYSTKLTSTETMKKPSRHQHQFTKAWKLATSEFIWPYLDPNARKSPLSKHFLPTHPGAWHLQGIVNISKALPAADTIHHGSARSGKCENARCEGWVQEAVTCMFVRSRMYK